uniref:Uncharacterized protein n=1 Tax=Urocitellus parryii TaxID=9999 RepID=A0A8D2H2P8_UROPR
APSRQQVEPFPRGHLSPRWNCHAHTCIHIVGPPTGLAAASCWGAACPGIEHVVDRALHLTVINGLGALGGAGEGREGQMGQGSKESLGTTSPSALSPASPGRPAEGKTNSSSPVQVSLPIDNLLIFGLDHSPWGGWGGGGHLVHYRVFSSTLGLHARCQ